MLVECPPCGGSGAHYVSHEMAIDGGDREMEGHFIPCPHCGGGVVEIEDGAPEPTAASSTALDELDISF